MSDYPVLSGGGPFTASGFNLLSPILNSACNISASTTITAVGATAILRGQAYSQIIGPAANGAVTLPANALLGEIYCIANDTAYYMSVFPPTGGKLGTNSANQSLTLTPYGGCVFLSNGGGNFSTVGLLLGEWLYNGDGSVPVFEDRATRDYFNPQTFQNFILYNHVTGTITAHSGGGQTSATALTTGVNDVTVCVSDADSVKLPATSFGKMVTVSNSSGKTLAVFPPSGSSIQDQSANASVSISAGKGTLFVGLSATKWQAIGLA